MDVRLLGSGGWLPTDSRETACVYVRDGADLLVLDAGTGLRRLVTEPQLVDGVERVHVALTHFHLDHIVGLAALSGFGVEAREVWMPARLLAGAQAGDLLERLLGPPFMLGAARVAAARELEGDAEIGPFRVEIRIQEQHPGRSLAFKVDGALAYCTDTAYDPANVEFARGARLLLHEAFWPGETTDDPGHTASGEAGRLAAEAGVERLVLVHVNPEADDEEKLARSARARFAPAEVGRDGLVLM
ncbi:MAG TPA: MBL fold metallo-hydrolase [Gaiellaceae bacterium]